MDYKYKQPSLILGPKTGVSLAYSHSECVKVQVNNNNLFIYNV